MKKIALAAALSMAATSAFAGGHTGGKFKEPVIEPVVIVEDVKSSSAAGIIVPLMLLLVIAAAAASR